MDALNMKAYPSLLALNERLVKATAEEGGKVSVEMTDKERLALINAINSIHEEIATAQQYANQCEQPVLDIYAASFAPRVLEMFLDADSGAPDPKMVAKATLNFALTLMEERTGYISQVVSKLTAKDEEKPALSVVKDDETPKASE